jgi:hypothetical protein
MNDAIEEELLYSLLFRNGVLLMQAHMQGGGAANFFPPHGHAVDVESQFQLVINVTKDACIWLNEKTDHLSDAEACRYVQEQLEECLSNTAVGKRRTAFGNEEAIMSSMRVVAVTCYPAAKGGHSSRIDNPKQQAATRRFLVHYNGF